MTELDPQLHALGDRLERAADGRPRRRRRPPRGAAAAHLAAPGHRDRRARDRDPGRRDRRRPADQHDDVAQSMPAGTLALAGTEPTCTVVTKDVEFHCVLAKAPAPEVSDSEGHRRAERRREQARQRRLPLARAATAASGSATSARPPSTRRSSARASSASSPGAGRRLTDEVCAQWGLTPGGLTQCDPRGWVHERARKMTERDDIRQAADRAELDERRAVPAVRPFPGARDDDRGDHGRAPRGPSRPDRCAPSARRGHRRGSCGSSRCARPGRAARR